MRLELFNGFYFLALFICVAIVVGLYFLLRNKSQKTQKIVLFSILLISLLMHFLKVFYPPYSTDLSRMLRDSWFINICGANIALFPFFFWSKNKAVKDYMFYLGVLGGLVAVVYPLEVFVKSNQAGEVLDILRFYFQHLMLFSVPLLMVVFKIHTLSYKRVIWAPIILLAVCAFCMLNQILQSEFGFIPLRGDDMMDIPYKNSSLIWGPPTGDSFKFISYLVPNFLKIIPYGAQAGQFKYCPLLWAVVPLYVYMVPLVFGLCMIFDFKNFKKDIKKVFKKN